MNVQRRIAAGANPAPDEAWAVERAGETVATASWWRRADGVAAVGHWTMADGAVDDAAELLAFVADRARAAGCRALVGPMDRNSWYRYRAVAMTTDEPPFAGEPVNPQTWNDAFARAGFAVAERYRSVATPVPEADVYGARGPAGVRLASPAAGELDRRLPELLALAHRAFGGNPYFEALSPDAFAELYRPLFARLDPRHCLLATDEDAAGGGRLAGFFLTYPAASPGTLVFKTIARDPSPRYAGLGAAMIDAIHARAREDGFHRTIHACLYDGNRSRRFSERDGAIVRRYVLYAKEWA